MGRIVCILVMFVCCFSYPLYGYDLSPGLHREYYPGGAVHYERNYKDGRKHGLTREFYEDGALKTEVMYVKGKKQGMLKEYYPAGALKSAFEYKDGVLHGVAVKYHENGKLEQESIYADGEPTGKGVKQFHYYDSGRLRYEYVYDKDKGGYRKEYHPNGQLSLEMSIQGWDRYSCKNYDEKGGFVSGECPAE